MKVITEGHLYKLNNFEDNTKNQEIQFIEKIPQTYINEPTGQMITVNDGTTNEEVLEMLINRMEYLQKKFPCKENACCITHLQEALMWLEKRTNDRIKRNVEGKHLA
jgi:predicted flavoprotein YhiN